MVDVCVEAYNNLFNIKKWFGLKIHRNNKLHQFYLNLCTCAHHDVCTMPSKNFHGKLIIYNFSENINSYAAQNCCISQENLFQEFQHF